MSDVSEISDMIEQWKEQVHGAIPPDANDYVQPIRLITYQPRFKHLRPPLMKWLWFNKLFYRVVEDKKFDNCYPASITTTNVDPDSPPIMLNLDFYNPEGGGVDVKIHQSDAE